MAPGRSNPFLDRLQEADMLSDGGYFKFDPKLHPRDRVGRFAEVIANLGWSETAELPNGVFVQRGPLHLVVRSRAGVVGRASSHDAQGAARMALAAASGAG